MTSSSIKVPLEEIELQAIRAQGAGGQNVNKVSSAIHLRFDVSASSLPQYVKDKLLKLQDKRVNSDGVIVIKAQTFRTQEKNKQEALERLDQMVQAAAVIPRRRVATRPSKGSVKRRLDSKKKLSSTKKLRGRVEGD